MLKTIIIFIHAIAAVSLTAQSGFQFLRTEKSPMVIATAQTSYMFNDASENFGLNPASSFKENKLNSRISFASLFEDANMTHLSVSFIEEKNQYGLEVSNLDIAGLEGRDVPSEEPLFEFGSKFLIMTANYAYKFDNGLVAGMSGKYLFEKIEFEDAYGFAGSFGLFRENNFTDGLSLGLAVNNFGSMEKLDEKETILPSDVLFGAGYSFLPWENIEFKLGNSSRYLLEDEEFENFTGLEMSYLNRFFIRSGYRSSNEGNPFSAGLGFVFDSFGFDYAYTPFSDGEVNDSHALSVSYSIK
jgi:hypothetical protein